MALDPPVSTPAHEWASNTTDALHTSSAVSAAEHTRLSQPTQPGQSSGTSTPGLDFPGAFPRDKLPLSEDRTPHAAVDHLAEAAPTKSASDIQQSVKSYLPDVGVQQALNTAKAYLPEGIVGAVESYLPSGMTNTSQIEKDVDPTSGAKPVSDEFASSGSASIDAASTTALPPSTRNDSLASTTTQSSHTPTAEGENREIVNILDGTSQTKPDPTFINAADATAPVNTLPTPPGSHDSSLAGSQPGRKGMGVKNTVGVPDYNGSGIEKTPTPPPKDESSFTTDNSLSSQPKVSAFPAQDHVKSGTVVGTNVPGTGVGAGNSAIYPPKSELSNSHVLEDDRKDASGGVSKASAASSSDENLGGGEKKQGRVSKVVHKVRDKLSHH